MYHPFSVPDIIWTSWYLFKKNFITIFVFSVISYIIIGLLEIAIGFFFSADAFSGKMFIGLLLIFTQSYTTLGLYKLIFTLIDSEYYEFEFKQILPSFKMIWSYMAVGFVLAFVITNFAILLESLEKYPIAYNITKGLGFAIALYLFLRIMFFITFIVDDQSRPFESLKQSLLLTKGYLLKTFFIFLIILGLVGLPATAASYFGFISILLAITYPLASILLAVAYRKLIYSHQDVDEDLAETK